MDHFAPSGRFSREEEADDEQEDASNSPRREISFMPAAAAAAWSSEAAAAAAASTSASASAPASTSAGAAPFRSAASGDDDGAGASGSGGGGGEAEADAAVEKEHMFDKVVTPSDVGKLNRLVIPKQYAEKYFPLDAAGNEKGLLLSFEDSAGKHWRFRYSYWNSSQSYVMTKGWSRFVKEKRLVAGDTVSFSRAAAEDALHRLFIDWKRRVVLDARAGPLRFSSLALPMMPLGMGSHHHYTPWGGFGFGSGGGGGGGGGGGFFMPPSPPATLYEHHRFRQGLDFSGGGMSYPAPTVGRQLLFFGSARTTTMPPHAPPLHLHQPPPRAPPTMLQPLHYAVQPSATSSRPPVVFDSVPVIESPTTAAKRVRLFGVNLDDNNNSWHHSDGGGEGSHHHQGNALSSSSSLQMPAWQQQRRTPTLRLLELPPPRHGGAESSAASSPSASSSSSKREARSSALDLDL
ncbi:hypothetical protein HU200_008500 [Digitaria exilis]|uniref:TF-B3 domain-containing protein n=1 Tax=Digitaria exilis TaxID=1010633 RepID=A0A835KQ47_9POAL|nr:hypothetical protein HU200_008500 [Digitaria exilis]